MKDYLVMGGLMGLIFCCALMPAMFFDPDPPKSLRNIFIFGFLIGIGIQYLGGK